MKEKMLEISNQIKQNSLRREELQEEVKGVDLNVRLYEFQIRERIANEQIIDDKGNKKSKYSNADQRNAAYNWECQYNEEYQKLVTKKSDIEKQIGLLSIEAAALHREFRIWELDWMESINNGGNKS